MKSLHIDQAFCHFEEIKSRVKSIDQNIKNKETLKQLIEEVFKTVASYRERILMYQAEVNQESGLIDLLLIMELTSMLLLSQQYDPEGKVTNEQLDLLSSLHDQIDDLILNE